MVNTLSWQRTAVVEVPQDRSIESAPQQHIPSLTQIDKKANTLGKNSQQTSSKDCACDNFMSEEDVEFNKEMVQSGYE